MYLANSLRARGLCSTVGLLLSQAFNTEYLLLNDIFPLNQSLTPRVPLPLMNCLHPRRTVRPAPGDFVYVLFVLVQWERRVTSAMSEFRSVCCSETGCGSILLSLLCLGFDKHVVS